MNFTPAAVAEAIRTLAMRYVGNPHEIEVGFQEGTDGSCYFGLRSDPRDESRLVGKNGSHVKCLKFLVESVGKAHGRVFTFRLHSTDGRHEPWPVMKAALNYDFSQDRDLLCEWLSLLGIEFFTVAVTPGKGPRSGLSFDFEVNIKNHQKALEMTAPAAEDGMSKVGALGTLYRAVAMQKGVRFQVTLADRNL